MFTSALVLSLISAVAAKEQCKLQFDGRVPKAFTVDDFDKSTSPFNTADVFGQGLKFSELIQLPTGVSDVFDGNANKPFEVTINDKSIFVPSATNVEAGFRRAEMLPASNDGKDNSTVGVKTLHFSLMKDDKRALNLSHEYQLVFLENAAFSTNMIVLKTGTIIDQNTADPDTLQFFGNVNSKPVPELFKTKFTPGVFHNFAVKLDFNKNTTQIFYSQGNAALKAQGEPVANDVSGRGQYHFGVLKKPIGGGNDPTHKGFQPSNINEGMIFGGIFQEDSADGCITLSP